MPPARAFVRYAAAMARLPIQGSDLRGAARLATDAVAGITDLVEAVHARIARLPGTSPGGPPARTRGITGAVYNGVRGVTRLVGGGADALLGLASPALAAVSGPADAPLPQREAVVAALNGVLGDHLAATGNPLATAMALRHGGRALGIDPGAVAAALPDARPRLLVLVHGLCMNDLQWRHNGHDHGAALAHACGYTPVYLHYNSGLHISANGRGLSRQLEQLLAAWPVPVERLVLMGHSMGGLVVRSAFHYGSQTACRWTARLQDMVFLGTPHQGAPLERAGNWIDVLLGHAPYAAPFARLGKLRSAGITDLRHGSLLDEDWAGADRFAPGARHGHVPLPAGVRCSTIGASIGQRSGDMKDRLLGDGLVPLDSALGRDPDPARTLQFEPDRSWTGYGLHHLQLLSDPQVFLQLERWLA